MAESPQIQAMRKLGFSDEEIKSVMAYDAKIDAGLDPLPLTAEQEKASREARSIGQKTVYNFTQRERKADNDKRQIVNYVKDSLLRWFTSDSQSTYNACQKLEVTNPEREMEFIYNGKKYRLTLSAPRK